MLSIYRLDSLISHPPTPEAPCLPEIIMTFGEELLGGDLEHTLGASFPSQTVRFPLYLDAGLLTCV